MTVLHIAHPSLDERAQHGREAREQTPLDSHIGWRPATDRPDPVALLDEQNRTREPDLVPVRHGRMMASPFTFYRGAAAVMAADLKDTPTAGLDAQLCGDAHLSNFGAFASPERKLLFDLNDFDETLPGPFEYDVKRMAASFTIAARNNGFSKTDTREATMAAVTAYREAMAGFGQMGTLDVWYAHLDEDQIMAPLRDSVATTGHHDKTGKKGAKGNARKSLKDKSGKDGKTDRELDKAAKTAEKTLKKAHSRDSLQALSKLAEQVDGTYRIISDPPIVVPLREVTATYGFSADETDQIIRDQFRAYRATLQADRRHLLERFQIVDAARKVVGVGSVGTRAFIVLLQGRDDHDPLFLQIKEATASVLEKYLPRSRYKQPGERVVRGQRMMQAASDIFLGWTAGAQADRHLYWRQLRDMKGSAEVEAMVPTGLRFYAGICGWTLARAHARSGDPVALAEYLGDGDAFDRSITDFSARYADQNEQDFQAFVRAVRSGRLQAVEGV
ncbi:DUF2252 domain-containing protein [Geodermatophilus sabuli]|uniref:DUF2252 domain-containing protein n=1 Tax=Geodermatophilus sabuli TaxID=1564158 RepID=A0A285EGC8_9ACTN|nr:DUF2252 domain-containing protein [Geodermatophilus sabuli]MBB3083182.1 uncharacterized protein (DUF2252 family) [Geodermatophilus sabuli]SNX98178.1 hypothetical protein SAMN06893097_109258 [Geodermatophilus sabuli]